MQLGIYRHYKNRLYLVLCESRHSETEESMVVYQALYGDYGYWVRPMALFSDKTATGEPRFVFISDKLTKELVDKYQLNMVKIKALFAE